MAGIDVKWRLDVTKLDRLDRSAGERSSKACKAAIEDVREIIITSWSGSSPSSPGSPPAKVSGELEASIKLLGHGSGGFVARGGNTTSYTLQVRAAHAAALEFGYAPRNLAPRPFIRPAVNEVSKGYVNYFRKEFLFI